MPQPLPKPKFPKLTLNVNGDDRAIEVAPDSMLLYALRDNLGLRGPKFGCGLSECGACTVMLNGIAVHSCVTPASAAKGQKITTLEGLGTVDKPNPLQQAFIDEQAAQCGYCINGMIMTAQAFLNSNPHPSRDAIKTALNNNLCRCGTHMRIVRAVERAAKAQSGNRRATPGDATPGDATPGDATPGDTSTGETKT